MPNPSDAAKDNPFPDAFVVRVDHPYAGCSGETISGPELENRIRINEQKAWKKGRNMAIEMYVVGSVTVLGCSYFLLHDGWSWLNFLMLFVAFSVLCVGAVFHHRYYRIVRSFQAKKYISALWENGVLEPRWNNPGASG